MELRIREQTIMPTIGMVMAFMTNDRGGAMSKIGPREAQLRALKEARYEERQQRQRQSHETARQCSPSPNALQASPNTTATPSPNKAYARSLRWRIKNRDRYNATMRDLMRRLRAEAKA
jgi:hypothetical protein